MVHDLNATAAPATGYTSGDSIYGSAIYTSSLQVNRVAEFLSGEVLELDDTVTRTIMLYGG